MKAAFFALLCLVAAGFISRPLFEGFVLSATSSKAAGCLEMLGNTTAEENGSAYIIGSVRNNCDRKFSTVTVTFKVDAQSGPARSMPETTIAAYSRDVEAGQTKEFRTAVPVSKTASYRFDAISAY